MLWWHCFFQLEAHVWYRWQWLEWIKRECQMQIDEWEQKWCRQGVSFLVVSDLVLCYHIVTFFVHFSLLKPLARLCFYTTLSLLSHWHILYIPCLNTPWLQTESVPMKTTCHHRYPGTTFDTRHTRICQQLLIRLLLYTSVSYNKGHKVRRRHIDNNATTYESTTATQVSLQFLVWYILSSFSLLIYRLFSDWQV